MDLVSQTHGDLSVVRIEAERIDASVAIQFKDGMRSAISDSTGRLVLDLGRVDFIDSSGLGAIVAAMKLMPKGRKMELAALTPNVDKVFRMTRMDTIFTIHPAIDDALAASA